MEINYWNFQKFWTNYWYILVFIEYMQWKYFFLNNTMVCVAYVKPVTVLLVILIILFPNKRDKSEY